MSCKTLLVSQDNVEMDISEKCKILFDYVNRGGLSIPSNYCYSISCIAFVFYQMLENDRDAHAEFLASSNHCRSFVATLTDRVKSDSSLSNLNVREIDIEIVPRGMSGVGRGSVLLKMSGIYARNL